MYKGPNPRAIEATHAFPELQATRIFQDMYSLLVPSKESMEDVEREVRGRAGEQGVSEVRREGRIELRKYADTGYR
ncbi:hypothetical protein FPV67DRAFT_605477 [Lyophyllum atratum]|nr:hypothetical protein FPV67DRAFT_605477 [Lyophyllum atratum]